MITDGAADLVEAEGAVAISRAGLLVVTVPTSVDNSFPIVAFDVMADSWGDI